MSKNDPRGSFIRWQSVTIGQLTYAINLVLGLSVATLGFQVALLLNDKFTPILWQKCAFSLSLFLLAASVVFGIWVVINRLRDFRATTTAARKREEGLPENEIEKYRAIYRRLGKCTWMLFCLQVGAFGLGVTITVFSVLASFSHKLL